jgi:glucose-6-phosphate 1-dehydrogenase
LAYSHRAEGASVCCSRYAAIFSSTSALSFVLYQVGIVRSGKRLAKRVSEISIQFRRVPHLLFRGAGRDNEAFLGYVEGDLLYIAPIEGERLGSLSVEAGDHVEAGAPLFAMETPLLEAQHREANARITQMEAQLRNLQAALNRPQQVAVLQAAVERAKAELTLSLQNFQRQKTLYAARDA